MRYSWKKHLAAAAVSVTLLTATTALTVRDDVSRSKKNYLDRDAEYYDASSHGAFISSFFVAILLVSAAIIPYELTLMALNSKRLSGDN
jgi:hypothetical protein